MTLKYCKTRKVKSPMRAHPFDAGIDLYVPEDLTSDVMKEKLAVVKEDIEIEYGDDGFIKTMKLNPGQSILIPTGLHVKVPDGYALILFNKSGVATKRHLHVGACVIDQNYEGECHINLTNVGNEAMVIEAGDKITQGIILPINYAITEEIESVEKLYAGSDHDRGTGGFGSSGTK